MNEWLPFVLGPLCGFLALCQMGLGIWCLVELKRNWRKASELWGMDWVDIVYRLKGQFGVSLTDTDFVDRSPEERVALTAGQLWDVVEAKIRAEGREVPAGGWDRVAAVLVEALNVDPELIVPEARLYADLGMTYGMY